MINPKEKYFLVSHYKKSPSDYGLKPVKGQDYFIDKNNTVWRNEYLWENYRGENENGFIRLPEPSFEDLWTLLTVSNIEYNKLGAAELLNRNYPFELKEKLKSLFKTKNKIDRNQTKRLGLLESLTTVTNYSKVYKVSPENVNADYQEWKKLKDDFDKLKTVKIKKSNFWKRITNSS